MIIVEIKYLVYELEEGIGFKEVGGIGTANIMELWPHLNNRSDIDEYLIKSRDSKTVTINNFTARVPGEVAVIFDRGENTNLITFPSETRHNTMTELTELHPDSRRVYEAVSDLLDKQESGLPTTISGLVGSFVGLVGAVGYNLLTDSVLPGTELIRKIASSSNND